MIAESVKVKLCDITGLNPMSITGFWGTYFYQPPKNKLIGSIDCGQDEYKVYSVLGTDQLEFSSEKSGREFIMTFSDEDWKILTAVGWNDPTSIPMSHAVKAYEFCKNVDI